MADVEKQMMSQRKSNISGANSTEMDQMNIINKQYAVNIQRSLLKKLEVSKKSTIEFLMAKDGLTAQADTALFELSKEATLQHYKLYPTNELDCKIIISKKLRCEIVYK